MEIRFYLSFLFLTLTQGQEPAEKQAGMEEGSDFDLFSSTTPDSLDDKTSLPESLIRDMLNLDKGKYTTMKFNYFNMQNYRIPWHREHFFEPRCYNDYVRCLLSLSRHAQVCAYNEKLILEFMVHKDSYCEIYFDNCRRGKRYWAIYHLGPCRLINIAKRERGQTAFAGMSFKN